MCSSDLCTFHAVLRLYLLKLNEGQEVDGVEYSVQQDKICRQVNAIYYSNHDHSFEDASQDSKSHGHSFQNDRTACYWNPQDLMLRLSCRTEGCFSMQALNSSCIRNLKDYILIIK